MPVSNNITPLPSHETSEAAPPVFFSGGFGYEEKRNGVASDYLRSLGHTALPPMPNQNLNDTSNMYTVRLEDGSEKSVPRQLTYFLAPRPETKLISSQTQEKRADELVEHIEDQGSEPVNGIFQSADAQNGLIAAHKRPDLFKNVILAFPAGLIKKDNVADYMPRMIKGAIKNIGNKHTPAESDDFEASTRPSSLMERRAEKRFKKTGGFNVASSVAVSYQNELLTELREQEDAPGVSLVLGLKDSMMSPERIIESLNSANDVDCLLITHTKHGINGNKKIMDRILELFPVMEEIKAKKKDGEDVGPLSDRVFFTDPVSEEDREKIMERVRELEIKSSETELPVAA